MHASPASVDPEEKRSLLAPSPREYYPDSAAQLAGVGAVRALVQRRLHRCNVRTALVATLTAAVVLLLAGEYVCVNPLREQLLRLPRCPPAAAGSANGLAPIDTIAPRAPPNPLRLPNDKRHVLITGGAGFVGFHLAQRLASEGRPVIALDDFNPYYSSALKRDRALQLQNLYGPLVRIVDGDLCDGALLRRLLSEFSPSHVVNLAAQAGVRYSLQQPQAYVRANVRCFIELLEALRQRPSTKLVYASSSSVYGSNKDSPFAEVQRVDNPNSLYAATKKANEAMAMVYHKLYNISTTGLRFFTVYGPWGRPDMAYFSFAYKMTKGLPVQVYGHGKPQRDFTYIDDIVTGVVGAMALGAPYEVFNLGNNEPVGLLYFIRALEKELGVTAQLNFTDMAPGDVLSTHADVERAHRLLGYKPTTSIEEGLRKFVAWFKSPLFKDVYATEGLWRTGKAWDRYS